jgi:(2Fe-2S) ferredoxin
LELAPGTFTQEFTRFKRKMLHPEYPVLVTSTNLTPPPLDKANAVPKAKNFASGYLFPDGRYFRDIDIDKTPEFIKEHLVPKESEQVDGETPESANELFASEPLDHSLILICGHKQRDARCGEIAPLIVNEFRAVLERHGLLYGQQHAAASKNRYRVGICSHIGGHVYAGNVLIMIPGTLGIWYGNVRPFHVQGIVQETLINRNIIQELHRGGRF